jgi:large repetitive protein
MNTRTLLYACSPLLLALALSSCGGGGAVTPNPVVEKPSIGQATLENPDAEGEELVLNIPVTGNPTITLEFNRDGVSTSSRSSNKFSALGKNYIGHVTIVKRADGTSDWESKPSSGGGTDFTPIPGRNPKSLQIRFDDFWGEDEVNPDLSSLDFSLIATIPGLTPVIIPVKPKKYKWDASIKKSVTINPVAGGSGEFALNIAHLGPSSAPILPGQLKVFDPVMAPLTLNGLGSVSANSTFWTCAFIGNLLGCKNSGTITTSTIIPAIRVLVNAPAGSQGKGYVNCGYIYSYDQNLQNNRSCLEGTIGKPTTDGKLDFAIKKELVKPLIPGGQGAYTLTVSNVGTIAAPLPDVWVYDLMPAGLTLNPAPPVIAGWDCTTSTPTFLKCKYVGPVPAQITPGNTSSLTFSVDVAKDIQGEVKNCAKVDVDGPPTVASPLKDINPQNNEACIVNPTGGTPKYHVVIKKQVEKPFDATGQGLFLLTPANAGPNPIPPSPLITVTDPMPSGMALIIVPPLSIPNWNCAASTTSMLNCTYTGSYPIAVGPFSNLLVPVQFVPGVVFNPKNCAFIRADGDAEPNNVVDACDNMPIPTNPKPDLSIKKTQLVEMVRGGEGKFQLDITNVGTPLASGPVTVIDNLPAGLTLKLPDAVTANAPLWNCAASTPSTLNCTANPILFPWATGVSKPIIVPVLVAKDSKAEQNCAAVDLQGDVNTQDNRNCIPVTYKQAATVPTTRP